MLLQNRESSTPSHINRSYRRFASRETSGWRCPIHAMAQLACEISMSTVNVQVVISLPPHPVFKKMGQQMSIPDGSNWWSIRHESEGWWFESPLRSKHFLSQNFGTFTRTSVRVSKMNAVARAELTCIMLTSFKEYPKTMGCIHALSLHWCYYTPCTAVWEEKFTIALLSYN